MKRSKLILTFYVGIIALSVATLSMSIAWYASNDRARVDSILITVDGDRDIKISTERDGEYLESLDNPSLMSVKDFSPVTAAHASTWVDTKKDMPVFYDETNYSLIENYSELVTVANRGFYSQKLYIKTDDDLWVTIKTDSTYINANPEYNKIYAEELYATYQSGENEILKALSKEEIVDRLNKLVNAMRFSILVTDATDYQYMIINPNKQHETYYGGLLDNDIDRYYDYFVRESDSQSYERVYGEIKGDLNNIVYDEPLEEDSAYENANEEPNAFNARHKKDVKRFNLEKSLENGIEIAKEDSHELSEFSGNTNPFVIPVYRDTPKEIVLSIYIEGWDLDSVNYTMGATFISNIAFKIEREM